MLIGGSTESSALVDGSQSANSKAKLDSELNRFLNLLVTQLKNQDPLDPMDANEFTTQLVQFASVEQQIFQNANLEKLLKLEQTKAISSLVDFIGTTVEADGRQVPLENGNAEFTYTMPPGAAKATLSITNSAGLTVYTSEVDSSSGKHAFVWDGKSGSGFQHPDGTYNVVVNGLDISGNLVNVSHTVWGRVTGANVENGEASLFIGDDITISQGAILSVKETKQAAAN
jgi:flagellar basal-body rod modification protein FlgD